MVRTGDGGGGSINWYNAEERPEGETGLGKARVVLLRKPLQTN